MQFITIPKQPKEKIKVVRQDGKTIGYFDFMLGFNEYKFKSEFDVTFSTTDLQEIGNKAIELNQTLQQ